MRTIFRGGFAVKHFSQLPADFVKATRSVTARIIETGSRRRFDLVATPLGDPLLYSRSNVRLSVLTGADSAVRNASDIAAAFYEEYFPAPEVSRSVFVRCIDTLSQRLLAHCLNIDITSLQSISTACYLDNKWNCERSFSSPVISYECTAVQGHSRRSPPRNILPSRTTKLLTDLIYLFPQMWSIPEGCIAGDDLTCIQRQRLVSSGITNKTYKEWGLLFGYANLLESCHTSLLSNNSIFPSQVNRITSNPMALHIPTQCTMPCLVIASESRRPYRNAEDSHAHIINIAFDPATARIAAIAIDEGHAATRIAGSGHVLSLMGVHAHRA